MTSSWIRAKQRRDLPMLMRKVQGAVKSRYEAGKKITRNAISNDCGLHSTWAHLKWQQPAVELVDRWANRQRSKKPRPIEPPPKQFTIGAVRLEFYTRDLHGRAVLNRLMVVSQVPPKAQCLIYRFQSPRYRWMRKRAGRWREWAYVSERGAMYLARKYGQQAA